MKFHKLSIIGERPVAGVHWRVYLDDNELSGVTNVEFHAKVGELCVANIEMFIEPDIELKNILLKSELMADDTNNI